MMTVTTLNRRQKHEPAQESLQAETQPSTALLQISTNKFTLAV